MTTRRLFGLGTAAIAAALVVMIQDASAFGKRNRGCDAPSCTPACATSVAYVDQKVTCYKTEWKTKKVEMDVVENKWVDQKFKYTVCVPTQVKEKVKVCELVQTKQAYKYTVNKIVAVKEKVKVCQNVWTEKEEKYTYMEPVWGKTKVMKTVCETVCVPTQVACAAPSCDSGRKGLFGRLCHKPSCDPCPTACADPCAPVMKTVMVRQVVSKQVEVEVATCTMVKKDGSRKVKVCTPTWVEQEVTVNKCVPTEMTGERIVCTPTWVEREVTVTKMVPTEKEGTQKVCVPTTTKKTVDVSYCERVAYETTIKVAVPCAAPAPACCTPAPACCH